jgi:cytochrome c
VILFTNLYGIINEKQIHTSAFIIALPVCFLFPVHVSTREERPLQFNRATFFAFLALALTGMAQASDTGDPALGAAVFKKCQSCHQVGVQAKNRAGPQLNDIFGRTAGGLEGAQYSKSMTRAGQDGLIWSEETLDKFLETPKSLVAKTRMSFRGLKDAEDRANLIAYLRAFSKGSTPALKLQETGQGIDIKLDPSVLAMVGDAEYGEYLSSECLTCHQSSGSNDGIPGITAWPTEDFVIAMHAYKQKIRSHPVMQMMAGRLSDEEIAALAAYFSDLE